MKKNAYYFVFILLFSGIFLSCNKIDVDKIAGGDWNPNAAVPLAYSTFDVYSIFAHTDAEDLVIVDSQTGALALIYRGDLITYGGDDFVVINDFSSTTNAELSEMGEVSTPNFTATINYSDDFEIDFNFEDGTQVKEFKFDQGTLQVNLNSSFQHQSIVTINIPELTKNGIAFSKNITIPAATSGSNSTVSVNENLSGYVALLSAAGAPNNQLKIQYSVEVTGSGQPLETTDNIQLDFGFLALEMDYAKGYFGSREIGTPQDTVLLKIFQFAEEGVFNLIDPKINFYLNNSFGIPIDLNLNQIFTINTNTGASMPLLNYSQTHSLNTPAVLGDSALTAIHFDNTNTSNLDQIVEPTPKYVVFDASLQANPQGNTGVDNFITKDSKIRIEAEVELPLHGLAHSFKMRDTVDFQSPAKSENLESVLFRLNADNGFPINVYATINVLDENHELIFTISDLPELMVDAADVDAQGVVYQIKHKKTDIVLSEEQIQLLDKAAYLEIIGEANTKDFSQGKNVKMFDYYQLKLKLGGQFGFKF